MKYTNFISIDLQNDFATQGGICYKPRPCVNFIQNTFVPYFREHNLKTYEIISDYRKPRPGDRGDCCHPGDWGYESIIPDDIKHQPVWVKCMNSPIWIRNNIGNAAKQPSIPYQDGKAFQTWLDQTVGEMNKGIEVVLYGLTADCCVLSTAQELNWRGYEVYILREAVDSYSGEAAEKSMILTNPPLLNWTNVVSWENIK